MITSKKSHVNILVLVWWRRHWPRYHVESLYSGAETRTTCFLGHQILIWGFGLKPWLVLTLLLERLPWSQPRKGRICTGIGCRACTLLFSWPLLLQRRLIILILLRFYIFFPLVLTLRALCYFRRDWISSNISNHGKPSGLQRPELQAVFKSVHV